MPLTEQLNYKDPVAGSTHAAMPVIGSRDLLRGGVDALVDDVTISCREHGFIFVSLDDEQQLVIDETIDAMQRFFSSPGAVKEAVRTRRGDEGWMPSLSEPAYQPGTVANVESFDITRGLIAGDIPGFWPEVDGFESAARACWHTLLSIADPLLAVIGHAAGLGPNFLPERCSSRELNTFRLLRYPAESRPVDDHEVGIAAHTDFECITLLYQSAPGLELRNVDREWLDVIDTRGRLIVLLDDMLEVWTNGALQATGHRVRRSPIERFSIVSFIAANDDVRVAPLPQFVSAERPAGYPEVGQNEHIEREISRARELNPNSS